MGRAGVHDDVFLVRDENELPVRLMQEEERTLPPYGRNQTNPDMLCPDWCWEHRAPCED